MWYLVQTAPPSKYPAPPLTDSKTTQRGNVFGSPHANVRKIKNKNQLLSPTRTEKGNSTSSLPLLRHRLCALKHFFFDRIYNNNYINKKKILNYII